MVKLKKPLFSFGAVGRLTRAITFTRRRKVDIAEKTPVIPDAKSLAQLSWRHMYQKATALWHALSAAEKLVWESAGTARHMTGYAWFMSQALRPNPGLYLPLQGGTMSGDIDMAGHRITDLPAPVDTQEPLLLDNYVNDIAPYLYHHGARVYHSADQAIAHATQTILAFNSERWDTDEIHDNAVSNSRLTCKTAGKYIITSNIYWQAFMGGKRDAKIYLNGATEIGGQTLHDVIGGGLYQSIATIYDLDVGDFVEARVLHSAGAPVDVLSASNLSPEFCMQRIGT